MERLTRKPVIAATPTAARINHWITAVSLILLALSGLALFHPSLYFLTDLFGGGQLTRAIHPWIGVVLVDQLPRPVLPLLHAQPVEPRRHACGCRTSARCSTTREEGLPELGKYNAGQKLVFWGQSVLILVLFCQWHRAVGCLFRRLHHDRPEAPRGGHPCAALRSAPS